MKTHTVRLVVVMLASAGAFGAGQTAIDPMDRERPINEVLGVGIGMPVANVRLALDKMGTREGRPTSNRTSKETWRLDLTPYEQIVVRADAEGRVSWVTAFVRRDQIIPFGMFGPRSGAVSFTDNQATWNVENGEHPYKLLVRGQHGRATVVTLVAPSDVKTS